MRTFLESVGVHLPEKVVTTAEVVAGCVQPLRMPLERLTGIESHRRAGPDEFTTELALRAARDCLTRSRSARPVDLVLCCQIARVEGPVPRLAIEPSMAARLAHRLGLHDVPAYDIANACAGTFTGILVADTLIRAGEYARVLVVSGEYITHLIDTAQRELDGVADPRLACLTLGDAAIACLVEQTDAEAVGFAALDLRTRPQYGELCVARPTEQRHGGFVMYTDAVSLAAASNEEGTAHAHAVLSKIGLEPEDVDHFLLHQTSRVSLAGAVRYVNAAYGRTAVRPEQVVDNLSHRGNTASTTHLLAMFEAMRAGEIRGGDRVLFGVTGSGLTVGTAVYDVDDLPHRMMRVADAQDTGGPQLRVPSQTINRGVVLAGWHAAQMPVAGFDSLAAAAGAVDTALCRSGISPDAVDLLVHAGVYRTDYIYEPAMAALIAARLRPSIPSCAGLDGPLCFDVSDGALGFLRALHVAHAAITSQRSDIAVVGTSEVDINARVGRGSVLGIATGAGAVVLAPGRDDGTGFTGFAFASVPTPLGWRHAGARPAATMHVDLVVDSRVDEAYIGAILEAVKRLGFTPGDARWVLSPFVTSPLSDRCRRALDVAEDRWVEVDAGSASDGMTLPVPLALAQIGERLRPGDDVLLLAAGAGVAAGCAHYRV